MMPHVTTVWLDRLRGRTRAFRFILCAALFILFAPQISASDLADNTAQRAPVASSNVETVIAAYLVNFLRYVEWPEAVPPAGEPWRIGLLGEEDTYRALDRLAQGKIVRGRAITIVDSPDPALLRDCQIVLLAETSPAKAVTLAKVFAGHPVLTVVFHDKNQDSTGAMIELILQGRNIRYRLNAALLTAAGLKPTPGLLENALPPISTPVALAL